MVGYSSWYSNIWYSLILGMLKIIIILFSAGRCRRFSIRVRSSRCSHLFRRLSLIWSLSSGSGKSTGTWNVNTVVRWLNLLLFYLFIYYYLLLSCIWLVCWIVSALFCYTGKLFWYKVHYNVHVRTHTKEHSHYCSKCSYSSITKSSLKRHQIQKHSGLLLPCSNPGCKYTTPDKYKLQAHLRTHQEQVTGPHSTGKRTLLNILNIQRIIRSSFLIDC